MWNHESALRLVQEIEAICPQYGCHVGLTGGCLYKDGDRKDCDIILYRIRQTPTINLKGLFEALKPLAIDVVGGFGWCYKATHPIGPIDILIPEEKLVVSESKPTVVHTYQ